MGFITFAVPLLVVSVSHILIFKLAKEQFHSTLTGENPIICNYNFRVRSMQNLKAIKTISIILGACIITWIPSLVLLLFNCHYALINNWAKICLTYHVVWPWAEAIAFTASAINPFIYYFRNEEFRRAFRRTFRWLPCGHTEERTQQTGLTPSRNPMVRNGLRFGDD